MKKVSIVILNWNGWEDTIDCLKSIENLKKKQFEIEIIIVDNASTNDSIQQINKYINGKDGIILLKNTKNLGFAGGNNVGLQHAVENGSDYIMALNNDTVLDINTVVFLFEFFEKNNEVGVASPKIYFAKGFEYHKRYKKSEEGHVIWYAGGVIDWNNVYGSNYGVDQVDIGQFDQISDTDFATGACMFLRASVLKKVGYFNESYFLYLEDADLSMRVKQSQFKVSFVPKSFLWHKVSQSSGIGSDLNDYFITRNRMLFVIQYAPIRAKIALIRESLRLMANGRPWQKRGIVDFYLHKLGKGSWGKS